MHKMVLNNLGCIMVCISIAFTTGCASVGTYYTAATVVDGTISNPKVGWNGYTISVPDGFTVFSTADKSPDTPSLTAEQQELIKFEEMESRNGMIKFVECFLIEDRGTSSSIVFSCETYEYDPWSTWGSVDLEYFLNKIIRAKKVLINDTKAIGKTIKINGKRGWQLSGTTNSDGFFGFNRDETTAYEGILLLGNLKDAYWIEGFCQVQGRAYLKQKITEMAESLEL